MPDARDYLFMADLFGEIPRPVDDYQRITKQVSVNMVLPAITGTATVGQTLACSTGTWEFSVNTYLYQWRRNGAAIPSATNNTYLLISADAGKSITCAVISLNPNGLSAPATSNAVSVPALDVPVNTTAPVITGTATVGNTLSCTSGIWDNDPVFYTYQWQRDAVNISGATTNAHVLITADAGTNITCLVTATNTNGASAPTSSNLLTIAGLVPSNTVAPVVSGTSTVGQTLSCTTGTWLYSPTSYTYQWRRDGVNIGSATSSTYLLVSADASTVCTCAVTATNATGVSSPAISNGLSIGSVGTTTVTAPNGQWWKFNGAVTNGTYVNGDVWVFDSGSGVSLIEVSTPLAGTGTTARNGGMINPDFNVLVENSPYGNATTTALKQGYDGRLNTSVIAYDETYNMHTSLPRTLHAGDTLVSSISRLPGSTIASMGSNPSVLDKMACVTIVNYTPTATEFRPSYFGTTKTRYDWASANLALLPDLTSPFDPKGAYSEGFHLDAASAFGTDDDMTALDCMHRDSFRDLQYWVFSLHTDQSLLKPKYNQHWYPGQTWGYKAGNVATYVMCDVSDRDHLLKRIIQVAIDAYAAAQGGGFVGMAPFANGAGFGNSPLWFIRLAGLLFNNTAMKNASSISTGKTDYLTNAMHKFGEGQRTYLSTSAHAQYLRVPDEDYTAGFPLYGDRPTTASPPQGVNGTARDHTGVYDMVPYKGTAPDSDLPYPAFPSILATTYECFKITGAEIDYMGNYMRMQPSHMGQILSSYAMGDEAFWPAAHLAFALRYLNDPQMWSNWGVFHDYAVHDDPNIADILDLQVGGTFNDWMRQMWVAVVGPINPPIFGDAPLVVPPFVPADGATGVVATSNLTVTFDMNIQFGTGDINIYRAADDVLFENFDVVTHAGTKLTISGATLTINPSGTMAASTAYYVQIDATAIESVADDTPFAGIADETTWNFTVASAGATTIYSLTLNSNTSGAEDRAYRNIVNITGGPGATNQIRVTFEASSDAGAFTIDNASIMIQSGTSGETATATPVNLLFSGSAGVTIAQGTTQVSDWATLGGFTAADNLMVHIDIGITNGNPRHGTALTEGTAYKLAPAGTQYNVISFSGTGFIGGNHTGFNKIEVQ